MFVRESDRSNRNEFNTFLGPTVIKQKLKGNRITTDLKPKLKQKTLNNKKPKLLSQVTKQRGGAAAAAENCLEESDDISSSMPVSS